MPEIGSGLVTLGLGLTMSLLATLGWAPDFIKVGKMGAVTLGLATPLQQIKWVAFMTRGVNTQASH